ncbi:MAG: AIR synthase family protein [Sulfolobales archaeon]
MVGKLPPKMLLKYVIGRVGTRDPSVLVGPSIGEDAAVVDIGGGKVLVAHVDPITGAIEFLGWLAVHISCNDIAVRGVKPRWLLPVLYMPENASEELVDKITAQIDEAAKEVGAAVIGGHSEITPGLDRPLLSMTAIGIAEKGRYVTTGSARVGDVVIMTKTAGVEGTAILSTDFREVLLDLGVPQSIIQRGSEFVRKVSIVREALLLAEAGLATSMHDPTEGGLLGGLAEIAYASGKTLYVREEKVSIAKETLAIARTLGLDPLKLISSGTLIATVPSHLAKEAVELLKKAGIEASEIGYVGDRSENLVVVYREDGTIEKLDDVYVEDEIYRAWRIWEKKLKESKERCRY